ncbi:hypothetical protein [Mesoplasma photuris]|uniref:hypothetical protein n=1 Tax=Mesoplasma photuris TaxID=217731 RepID=UPI0004E18353|nr:hypothetical protein [Mesoplasma photuris]
MNKKIIKYLGITTLGLSLLGASTFGIMSFTTLNKTRSELKVQSELYKNAKEENIANKLKLEKLVLSITEKQNLLKLNEKKAIDLNKLIKAKTDEILNLKSEQNSQKFSIVDNENKNMLNLETISNLESEKTKLIEQLNHKNQKIEQLNSEITSLKEKLDKTILEVDEKDIEIELLRGNNIQLEEQVQTISDKNVELNDSKIKLEWNQKDLNKLIVELQEKNSNKDREIKSSGEEIENFRIKLTDKNQQLLFLENEYANKNNLVEKQKNEIAELKAELESTKSKTPIDVDQLTAHNKFLKEQVQRLNKVIEERNAELEFSMKLVESQNSNKG